MEEGQAFIEHSDGLVLLQLQRLLEILHGCHIILKDNERKEGICTDDKKSGAIKTTSFKSLEF